MNKLQLLLRKWLITSVLLTLVLLPSLLFAASPKGDIWPWHLQKTPNHSGLLTVDALESNLIVAGGKSGEVILWDGRSWKSLPRLPVPSTWESRAHPSWARPDQIHAQIIDIDILAPDSIWVITKLYIFEWNGKRWKEHRVNLRPTVRYPTFRRIQMISKKHGFIVGGQPPNKALVLELKKGKWGIKKLDDTSSANTKLPKAGKLWALDLLPSGEGWAGGRNSLIRVGTKRWTSYPNPTAGNYFIGDIALSSTSSGWAGMSLRLIGGQWTSARELYGQYYYSRSLRSGISLVSTNASGVAFAAGSQYSEAPRLIGSDILKWDEKRTYWDHDFKIKNEEITDIVVLDDGSAVAVGMSGKVWSRAP